MRDSATRFLKDPDSGRAGPMAAGRGFDRNGPSCASSSPTCGLPCSDVWPSSPRRSAVVQGGRRGALPGYSPYLRRGSPRRLDGKPKPDTNSPGRSGEGRRSSPASTRGLDADGGVIHQRRQVAVGHGIRPGASTVTPCGYRSRWPSSPTDQVPRSRPSGAKPWTRPWPRSQSATYHSPTGVDRQAYWIEEPPALPPRRRARSSPGCGPAGRACAPGGRNLRPRRGAPPRPPRSRSGSRLRNGSDVPRGYRPSGVNAKTSPSYPTTLARPARAATPR